MLTFSSAFYELKNKLQPLYDEREAISLAHEIMHYITGLQKVERLLQKDTFFTDRQQQQYNQAASDLLKGRPLQYITGTAWFLGREYQVNEHVLIPRPETEELVQRVIEDSITKFQIPNPKSQIPNPKIQSPNSKFQTLPTGRQVPNSKFRIMDIGTGSGCIAVSLKLAIPYAEVTACDISTDALEVAKKNAEWLGADVHFIQLDFLDTAKRNKQGMYDVIVSNPPYIPFAEKKQMHTNVKDHEPAIALFVPDDDALVFYRAIAIFGKAHLNSNGYIYCELASSQAMACKKLFEDMGYEQVEINKDMHGNWRMLKAGNRVIS